VNHCSPYTDFNEAAFLLAPNALSIAEYIWATGALMEPTFLLGTWSLSMRQPVLNKKVDFYLQALTFLHDNARG